MSESENAWARRGTPGMGRWEAMAMHGQSVLGTAVAAPALSLPVKLYSYRGIGRDTLTAHMDDEPTEVPPLSRRQERMQMLAELRLWDGSDETPPAGYVTAVQAAEMLGVSRRTVERYKSELGLTGRPS